HAGARERAWLFGACLLVRRDAADEVGLFDEDFFMFSEETDWCYRFRQAGWRVFFFPGAEAMHVGGASHGGSLFAENVRGHLRFLAKHRGTREAERARRLLLAGVRLRLLLFRGDRLPADSRCPHLPCASRARPRAGGCVVARRAALRARDHLRRPQLALADAGATGSRRAGGAAVGPASK